MSPQPLKTTETHKGQQGIVLSSGPLRFSSQKTVCPCDLRKRSFCRLIDYPTGGKCWSTSCGQRFFAPPRDRNTSAKPAVDEDQTNKANAAVSSNKKASLEAPSGFYLDRVHHYWTDDGQNYLFRVVVFKALEGDGRKKISQQRFAGSIEILPSSKIVEHGCWYYGLDKLQLTLYRAPALRLLRASNEFSQVPVFILEGEKDVDTLTNHGAVATTSPGGAGSWREEYSRLLKGMNCVVVSDNDEAGRRHAKDVISKISRYAASAKLVDLRTLMPGLPEKGDVTDFINLGGQLWKPRA